MKCKNCNACQKGFFKSQPNKYVCIGTKEPFVIDDIEQFYTQYPMNATFNTEMYSIESVTNTIKEYSGSFEELYNLWKYVVEQDDTNIIIKYMEMNNDKTWVEKQSIEINLECAKKLFKEVAICIDRVEFKKEY